MERFGLDEELAFRYLVRLSSNSNVKLRDIARELVERGQPERTRSHARSHAGAPRPTAVPEPQRRRPAERRRARPRPWMMGPAPRLGRRWRRWTRKPPCTEPWSRRALTGSGSSTRPGRPCGPTPGWPTCSGRSPSRWPGFRVEDALDEQGREQLARTSPSSRAGRGERGRTPRRCSSGADGTEIWVLVSWSTIRDDDGERVGWLHRITEYTERKTLLEALQEREQQLASAQRSPTSAAGSGTSPRTRHLVRPALPHLRARAARHDATYEGFLGRIHPDDRERVRAVVESAFAGPTSFEFERPVVRLDGGVGWVRGLGHVERGPDGAPLGWRAPARTSPTSSAPTSLAAEATRRLELLQEMAMAANQATSLREAIANAGLRGCRSTPPGRRSASTGVPDDALVRAPSRSRGRAARPPPTPALAARACRSQLVELAQRRPPRQREHAQPGGASRCMLAGDVTARHRGARRRGAARRQLACSSSRQIAGQLSLVAERERTAHELAEARDEAMEASRAEVGVPRHHEPRDPHADERRDRA